MNILIFSWRGPMHPNSGGAEIATLEHAKYWANHGHQVYWFTSKTPDLPPKETIDQVIIIRRGFQILQVQIEALKWYLFSSHPKFDLVVDQFHGIPFFTPLFVRSKKLAFIHEVAKEVWWTNHLHFPINYLFGSLGFLLEPLIFMFFYRRIPFFTVSQSTKKDLISWTIPNPNIHVIPNGITTIRTNIPKEVRPTIMFLGALAKDKGIEDALKTFSIINSTLSNWQFWVVGKVEDKYLKRLRKISTANTTFWGFVDDKKKFELLARAHILLNPSIREGWGLVNIEANSVGTPVVAYDVPGCRDSIKDGHTGFLCPKNDTLCLARTTINLFNNTPLYENISIQAKLWSRNFTWSKSASEGLKLIQDL